jgi:Uma2 family endonuclease
MVQTPIRPITLEHFLGLPETKPASEYIDGQIIQKPMPQGHHSIIQCKLSTELDILLEREGIATVFTELRCTFGDRSIVPDISVFENSRVPVNEAEDIANIFTIAPDWTIEILSPDQRTAKVIKNINHCLAHNSQMGWLIDPEDKLVIVVGVGQKIDVFDDLSIILPVPEFAQHIRLTGNDVFGWTKRRKIITSR